MNAAMEAPEPGRVTIESAFGIRGTFMAERYGPVGFDRNTVDFELGIASWNDVAFTLPAFQVGGTHALVRVIGRHLAEMGSVLDVVAIALVDRHVATPEQASQGINAMCCPTDGARSIGIACDPLGTTPLRHVRFCVFIIGTAEGVIQLDEIATTPGGHFLLMGVIDLAISRWPPKRGFSGRVRRPRSLRNLITSSRPARNAVRSPAVRRWMRATGGARIGMTTLRAIRFGTCTCR